ncbi:MAG TPA: PilN domain-containing protein [Candidatus Binatia bacterium]|jgi:type IV pilus assembly protein PilN
MIRINLLPVKEIKAEVSRRREIAVGAVALGVTVASLAAVFGYQWYRQSVLQKELAGLQSELKMFNAKVKDVNELQTKILELETKNKVLENIKKNKSGPVRVMESLSAATPTALWLTEFRENSGDVTITGLAVDNQTIAEFLKSLESYAVFKEPELVESSQSDQTGAAPRRFSIKSKIIYHPTEQASAENTGSKPGDTKAN